MTGTFFITTGGKQLQDAYAGEPKKSMIIFIFMYTRCTSLAVEYCKHALLFCPYVQSPPLPRPPLHGPPLPRGPPRSPNPPLPLPRAAWARRMADLPLPAAPVLAAPRLLPMFLNMGAFLSMSGRIRNLKQRRTDNKQLFNC